MQTAECDKTDQEHSSHLLLLVRSSFTNSLGLYTEFH